MSRSNPRFRRFNPSLPPVGTSLGVVQYVIQGTIEGQMTLSTFMYSGFNPNPTVGQLSTLLGNIHTNLLAAYRGLVSADWTWVRELLKVVHRNDIATTVSLTSAGAVGARPAGHEPTEVAGILLRQTAFKGQHGRGRVSIPAISTADVVSSNWQGAAIALAVNSMATAMLATASDGTNTWTPSIGQRGASSPKLITGVAVLTSVTGVLLLGTIRRRKIGRGK